MTKFQVSFFRVRVEYRTKERRGKTINWNFDDKQESSSRIEVKRKPDRF